MIKGKKKERDFFYTTFWLGLYTLSINELGIKILNILEVYLNFMMTKFCSLSSHILVKKKKEKKTAASIDQRNCLKLRSKVLGRPSEAYSRADYAMMSKFPLLNWRNP